MILLAALFLLAADVSAPPQAEPPPLQTGSPKPEPRNTYPWKLHVRPILCWIGQKPALAKALGDGWITYSGVDTPHERNAYGPADHSLNVNPFYVALPFNDLAFPDKAAEQVPASWRHPSTGGKPLSACQHRWVEIKADNGRPCYAHWELVGPGHNDNAAYVFGPSASKGPGIGLSPAVMQYLDIREKPGDVSWRFIDAEQVPPGVWMKYEEQTILYNAMHQGEISGSPAPATTKTAPAQTPASTIP